MSTSLSDRIEQLLPWVDRPARYLGGEVNSVVKDPHGKVRFALCFPDTYEIGQSHMGLVILYHLLNSEDWIACERAFLPWVDMLAAMRREGLPWFTLETCTPVAEMDLVGFSLPYEMLLTNVLEGLDLAGIPIRRRDRREQDPIVLAGGPVTYNPEPASDFIDVFAIGEAEDLVLELARVAGRRDLTRAERLQEMARIPGCYVPALVEVLKRPDGSIEAFRSEVDLPILKRLAGDLEGAFFPTSPVVPFLQTIHDRANLEVHRGCVHGCRYCQAGMIYRPQRLRSLELLARQANEIVRRTGFQELGLSSLNTCDYPDLVPLVERLSVDLAGKNVALGLPSLRVDGFSVKIADALSHGKRTQVTLAPEAGSQRLRDLINKNLTREQILGTVRALLDAGWRDLKLYFMLGLPGETDEDLREMASLLHEIQRASRGLGGRPLFVTTTLSSFVPKPHTPFQYVPMARIEVLQQRLNLLRDRVGQGRIKLRWRDFALGEMEAVFSRGGRELGAVVERAWRLGCRFDGWTDQFRHDLWTQAFRDCGLDPAAVCYRDWPRETIFPWDVVGCGVTKDWLWDELQAAMEGRLTPNCFFGSCSDCGVRSHFTC
ncbi:MAG: TIGR03960 family B12-binding radical SAM protein [Candidatus Riflebacteria bacterium]|nr:TIGR03960 family B12-binding radical SAM protein [Candidatus Riflebacteria bacterium]